MIEHLSEENFHPDASELALCTDNKFVCETYIFEPAQQEKKLGHLYAVGETEDRDGIGKELMDLTVTALQREYYRDPSRGLLASFESALHQANLVLHEAVQKGIKDWMGHFHFSVGVLADKSLHISVAGNGVALLIRRSRVTDIATGLSHSPITNPLRSFSQVASGTVSAGDTLFFGTPALLQLYRQEDLTRISIDHSAASVTTRMRQLYEDQGSTIPVSVLAVFMLPAQLVAKKEEPIPVETERKRSTKVNAESLQPRKPIVIHQSWFKNVLHIFWMAFVQAGHAVGGFYSTKILPRLKSGSQKSGRALYRASQNTGKSVRNFSSKQWERVNKNKKPAKDASSKSSQAQPESSKEPMRHFAPKSLEIAQIQSLPRRAYSQLKSLLLSLPKSSRIFAVITVILILALLASLTLLRIKRVEDEQIERASEILHEARTKKDAAEAALIYDDRDQARALIDEAGQLAQELEGTGLYAGELQELRDALQSGQDRLQKVVRFSREQAQLLGDYSNVISGKSPQVLFFVDSNLYTFNPENNSIVKMDLDGNTDVVSQTTQGIGFLTGGIAHEADKNLILSSDTPSVVLFDTKLDSLQPQEISFATSEANIDSLAAFGNRLYVLDKSADNIFVYNKTLRGYSGGTPWITDEDFESDSIKSIAIDGNIFTLHDNGSIGRLFKGERAEFEAEPVNPKLAGGTKIITNEDLVNIYIVDPAEQRVVVYNKKGELVRQIFLDTIALTDAAIDPDEEILFVLDGTQVLAVTLE